MRKRTTRREMAEKSLRSERGGGREKQRERESNRDMFCMGPAVRF